VNYFIVLISSIISGLLGVLISVWFYRRSEIRQAKFRIIQQLLGNRNDLKGQSFTEALNQVFVGFHDSEKVLLKLKEFHETIIRRPVSNDLANQKLLELFKAICEELNIEPGPLTDSFFLQAFNIRP
jgi:hypothetical protein